MSKEIKYDDKIKAMLETGNEAIEKALLHHKAVGNTIAYWKDGKIVYEKLSMDDGPDNRQKKL